MKTHREKQIGNETYPHVSTKYICIYIYIHSDPHPCFLAFTLGETSCFPTLQSRRVTTGRTGEGGAGRTPMKRNRASGFVTCCCKFKKCKGPLPKSGRRLLRSSSGSGPGPGLATWGSSSHTGCESWGSEVSQCGEKVLSESRQDTISVLLALWWRWGGGTPSLPSSPLFFTRTFHFS